MKRFVALLGLCAMASGPVFAGVYTDDFAKCLVAATSHDDRVALIKWIFMAMSTNPAISSLSNVKKSDIDAANKVTGVLFTRLVTEDCKDKAKLAVSYEGSAAMQLGFQVLGQVAGSELFASADVQQAMGGLKDNVDDKKIAAVLKGDDAPAAAAAPPATVARPK